MGLRYQSNHWLRAGLELIFPRRCVYSGALLEDDAPLPHVSQAALENHLFPIQEPFCARCGYPFVSPSEAAGDCVNCSPGEPAFRRARSLVHLRGLGQKLVHELKYRGGLHLRADLEGIFRLFPAVSDFVAGATLVPVPLHPSRQRYRGFNQSEMVARGLADASPGCRCESVLVRARRTATQTRLNRAQRTSNVDGAFALARGAQVQPLRRYVVIDDVATTGATLRACALALREAGADIVDAATFAHG